MINLLNKLPIPNLRHYSLFSFSLLSLVALYAYKVAHDLRLDSADSRSPLPGSDQESPPPTEQSTDSAPSLFWSTYTIVANEPWCVWVLINFSYCCLILFSKIIQMVVFGKLRAVENQHIKDQFWNFIFLKFIFIFGVLNLENISEVTMWCIWFSMIGFLAIHSQICKDRFEFLSFSASTQLKSHLKVLVLLGVIQAICFCLVVASFAYFKTTSFSMNLFMFADSVGLTLRTFYVITRYALHLSDVYNLVEITNKGTITYYIDFVFEISVILIDLLHYLHMLIYGNFYLSMASLVICMELKRLFFDFKKRLKRHSNYLRVIEKMEKRFPWASADEMADADKCAVCWEKLEKARRLPCSHIFHHNCLRSWLEQDTSCPKCRKSLQDDKENQTQQAPSAGGQRGAANPADAAAAGAAATATGAQPGLAQQPQQVQRVVHRNLFQFNGSRYISWLPSFSLQVTNGTNVVLPGLLRTRANLEPDRLADMTAQIRQLFPHLPVDLIQQDLAMTHSAELTVENILEDRLNPNTSATIANPVGGADTAATQRAGNLLNDDESSDVNDDDDSEEDVDSTEDEIGGAGSMRTNSERGLRRRNILSRMFDSFNSSQAPETRSAATAQAGESGSVDQQQPSTSSLGTSENENELLSRLNDDSAIISKYSTSSTLSENANSLILRKRDLILNSKKRFLEKMNAKPDKSSTLGGASSASSAEK